MAIKNGFLPETFLNYRQKYLVTWDIESLEQKPSILEPERIEAFQNICSVSISSNLPVEDQYFVRESSEPEAASNLVTSFMDHLFKLEENYQEQLPKEIFEAIGKLDVSITSHQFSKRKLRLKAALNYLKQYSTLPVYAFNCSRYDIPCIIGLIYDYCSANKCSMNAIKRGTGYMALTVTKVVGDRKASITFRDVLNYTAPCRLSKYLKQWGSELAKSIFPYSLYNSIEEVEQATEFPPYEAFYSELTQSNVNREEYNDARNEFERRKRLPSNHPEKMNTMKDWLKYYNCLDTQPLVGAMENSFQKFFFYFKVDPNMHLSLPTLAFK